VARKTIADQVSELAKARAGRDPDAPPSPFALEQHQRRPRRVSRLTEEDPAAIDGDLAVPDSGHRSELFAGYATPLAAASISDTTSSGCDTIATWLDATSTVVAPIREAK